MAISKRQYTALKAMDIPLWIRRDSGPTSANNDSKGNIALLIVDESACKEHQLFIDILQSLELSVAEVNFSNNHIDLGLINWSFHAHNNIVYADNTLLTPTLTELALSPELKSQLWRLFNEQNILCH